MAQKHSILKTFARYGKYVFGTALAFSLVFSPFVAAKAAAEEKGQHFLDSFHNGKQLFANRAQQNKMVKYTPYKLRQVSGELKLVRSTEGQRKCPKYQIKAISRKKMEDDISMAKMAANPEKAYADVEYGKIDESNEWIVVKKGFVPEYKDNGALVGASVVKGDFMTPICVVAGPVTEIGKIEGQKPSVIAAGKSKAELGMEAVRTVATSVGILGMAKGVLDAGAGIKEKGIVTKVDAGSLHY